MKEQGKMLGPIVRIITYEMSDKCSLLLKFWLSEMMTQTKQSYFQLLTPFDTFLASLEILNVEVNPTCL